MKKTIVLPLMAIAACMHPQEARAAFALVDDYEGYTAGSNGTAAGWTQGFPGGGSNGTTSAINTSALATGQGAIFTYGGSGGQINYLTVPTIAAEGTTGTLFFQAAWASTGSDVLFATGRSGAGAYGDLATLFRVPSDLILEVHNSGAYANTSTTVANSTIYNFWVVINNTANTWDLHYSTGTASPTLIQSGITFRNTTAGAINTLYIGTNSGSAPVIDNIFVDSTGSNLANPVPEPSALLLGAVGAAAVFRRRR